VVTRYHVTRPARVPARSCREEVIGFICIDCPGQPLDIENKNPVYTDKVLRGVERRISGLGWSLLITHWNGEDGQDLSRIAAMPGKVDGILISIGSFPARLLEWMATRVPVTVIAGDPAEREVDVVAADNRSGSAAIVTHLVEDHGKRRIYHVDGPPGMPDPAQRRSGLLQVLRDHPAVRLAGTTHGSNYAESGLAAGRRILAEEPGERACDRLLERIATPGLHPHPPPHRTREPRDRRAPGVALRSGEPISVGASAQNTGAATISAIHQ
jgi:DNA-binding LacI/PurR family transcriptional regulator